MFCNVMCKGGFPIHRTASLRIKSSQTRQRRAHAIFRSYCTRILVAEVKSLILFRRRSGPHACAFAML